MTDTSAELVTVTFTCHTSGCGNEGIPIDLEVPPDLGGAMCGACGNPIDLPEAITHQEGSKS